MEYLFFSKQFLSWNIFVYSRTFSIFYHCGVLFSKVHGAHASALLRTAQKVRSKGSFLPHGPRSRWRSWAAASHMRGDE
jgi:hypothetical protein